MAEETKLYVLLSGVHKATVNGERVTYRKGESVPLTASQYQNFKDRFKPAAAVIAETAAAKVLKDEEANIAAEKANAEAKAKAEAEAAIEAHNKKVAEEQEAQEKAKQEAEAEKAKQDAEAQAAAEKAAQEAKAKAAQAAPVQKPATPPAAK